MATSFAQPPSLQHAGDVKTRPSWSPYVGENGGIGDDLVLTNAAACSLTIRIPHHRYDDNGG